MSEFLLHWDQNTLVSFCEKMQFHSSLLRQCTMERRQNRQTKGRSVAISKSGGT